MTPINPYRSRWITFSPVEQISGGERVKISLGSDRSIAFLERKLDEDAVEFLGRRWRLNWHGLTPSVVEGSWATLDGAVAALRVALGEAAEQPREQLSFSGVLPRRPQSRGGPLYSVRFFWYGRPFSGTIDYEASVWEPGHQWFVKMEPDDETNLYMLDGVGFKRLSEAKRRIREVFAAFIETRFDPPKGESGG